MGGWRKEVDSVVIYDSALGLRLLARDWLRCEMWREEDAKAHQLPGCGGLSASKLADRFKVCPFTQDGLAVRTIAGDSETTDTL
jgi:hypothetical protein